MSSRSAPSLRAALGAVLGLAAALIAAGPVAGAGSCSAPPDHWLACEDFERGHDFADWFAGSSFVSCKGCGPDNTGDPDRVSLSRDQVHSGQRALYLPAAEAADFQGATLTWRSCEGEKREGCPLRNHPELYFRAWVRLAEDHRYVHHFLRLGGSRPLHFWDSEGNAGCRPNGYRSAGTTLDFNRRHELFFYTYFPGMHCDRGGYCSGERASSICQGCAAREMACRPDEPECCWGNHFSARPKPILPVGQWVCVEMMMHLNTPGKSDGEMAFWVDDRLGHRQRGMNWRSDPTLGMNKAALQHFIAPGDADQPNRLWWDDVVVATARIGCT